MTIMAPVAIIQKVVTRPVTARVVQFRYYDDLDFTSRMATMVGTALGVTLSRSHDVQSGTGYHLRCGDLDWKLLSDGDWIVVDSFGRADVVKDKDFRVYYELAPGPIG